MCLSPPPNPVVNVDWHPIPPAPQYLGPGPRAGPGAVITAYISRNNIVNPSNHFLSGEGVADDSAGSPLAGNTNDAIAYDSHSTRKRSFIFPTGLCSLTRFTERVLTGHLRARGQRRRQLGGPAGSPRQPASQPCLGFTPRIIIGWSRCRR